MPGEIVVRVATDEEKNRFLESGHARPRFDPSTVAAMREAAQLLANGATVIAIELTGDKAYGSVAGWRHRAIGILGFFFPKIASLQTGRSFSRTTILFGRKE